MRANIGTIMRTTAIATGVGALVAAVPSGAATKKTFSYRQTVTQTYVLPIYSANEAILGTVHLGGAQFPVPSWARYISVEVTDATGLPVAGDIEQETRVTDQISSIGTFCGRTAHSYPVDPSAIQEIWVTLNQGPCSDGTLAAGTTGTIALTFTG